jgi:D-glycerate 3-kinase
MRPASLSYLILLTTDDLANVYSWRLDQEHALREKTGSGMSDVDIVEFVRGYMPAYELYLEKLKRESFVPRMLEEVWKSTQLKVTLDRERCVVGAEEMY